MSDAKYLVAHSIVLAVLNNLNVGVTSDHFDKIVEMVKQILEKEDM